MKKIFLLLLLATFTFSPIVSNAGFFDFLNIKNNQVASVTSSLKSDSSVVFKKGDKAEVILKVQSALASQGFYKGNISGLIGPKTEIAISEWQKSKGLVVTGVLDISTINSILGLVEKSDNRDGGVSVSSIPVCSPNDSPWIKVKNPDGGETYYPGQSIKVGWVSCNLPAGSEVFIAFNAASTDLSGGYIMVGATPDDGIAQVTLPPASDFGTQQGDWYYGLHYKIGVGVSNSTTPDDYRDYSDNLFSIVESVGVNCEAEDVNLSILPTTPSGVQMNTNDFPVLEFNIDNNTSCDVKLDSMKFIYMVTDTLPYFDEITLREKDTLLNVGTGEANTGISGEFLSLGFGQNGYIITSGDEQDFLLVLEGYNQPTQGQLPYNEFINKSIIFGLPKYNSLNFRFTNDMFPHIVQLFQNTWGNVVQLPL